MKFADYPFFSEYEKPLDHQVETMISCLKNPRNYVFLEPGLGKTLIMLWTTDFLFFNLKIKKVLVVAPLSTLKQVWASEIFRNIPHRRYAILHGTKANRVKALNSNADYYLINHDGIKTIESEILAAKFDVIIIDELTAFQNAQTNRTKCMMKIAKEAKAVYGLTGSPTANSLLQAYGMARVVNPKNEFVPRTYTRFRDIIMTQISQFDWIPKPGAVEFVAQMLSPQISFRRDDCINLPPVTVESRYIEMSKEQAQIYKEMSDEFVTQIKENLITSANSAVKLIKLLQISCGAIYDDERILQQIDCSNKLEEVAKIWEEIGRGKMLIFATFTGAIENIVTYMRNYGAKCEVISGQVNANKRAENIAGLQKGDVDILVMQVAAAAHGLTLTASNTIIWFGPTFSNELYLQANDRIRRIGQSRPQLIVRLVASEAENRAYRALEQKQKVSDALFDLLKAGAI